MAEEIKSKIIFGSRASINSPTPAGVVLWVRVFTVAGSAFLGWMATASVMGPDTKDIVTQILGLALLLANVLSPLFGVDLQGRQSVPAEDVTTIETK